MTLFRIDPSESQSSQKKSKVAADNNMSDYCLRERVTLDT